jgi:hypothetical protein
VTVKRPPNVYGKPLANGKTLWSWQPSSKDRKKDCPLKHRTLGTDPVEAFRIARDLNQGLADWRNGVQSVPYVPGTFGWLLMEFLSHKDVQGLSETAQAEYERHARYMMAITQAGVPLEKKTLESFTPLFALKLYERLAEKHSIGIANRCLVQARYAWNKLFVYHHTLVPESNPFEKVEPSHRDSEETIPATYDELQSFISAAIALGELGVAVGARLCWDLTIRPSEVFGGALSEHWRPETMPHHMWVGVDKTSKGKKKKSSTWMALDYLDPETGEWVCLSPELETLMRMRQWPGPFLCMRERQVGKRVFAGEWVAIKNADKIARRIRKHAGLGDHVTLESFRHGGLTEMGDSGLSDTLAIAISRHRQRQTLGRYIHTTDKQVVTGQRMRLAHRSDKP